MIFKVLFHYRLKAVGDYAGQPNRPTVLNRVFTNFFFFFWKKGRLLVFFQSVGTVAEIMDRENNVTKTDARVVIVSLKFGWRSSGPGDVVGLRRVA